MSEGRSSDEESLDKDTAQASTRENGSDNPQDISLVPEASPGDNDAGANSRALPIDELGLNHANSKPAVASATRDENSATAATQDDDDFEATVAAATASTDSTKTEKDEDETSYAAGQSKEAPLNDQPGSAAQAGKTRVVFLNEQISHHPPISHFMLEARAPHGRVRCVGADQLSAKVSQTARHSCVCILT